MVDDAARDSLEVLFPLSQAYRVPLGDLVGAPEVGDPRVRLKARKVHGRTVLPLTRAPVPADHDLVLGPGEAAEFDTRVPHWFGSTGEQPAEILSLFGPQGERVHARARSVRGRAPQT